MPAVIAGFIFICLVIAVIINGIFNIAIENAIGFWLFVASMSALIAAPIIAGKKRKAAEYARLPRDGPMRVNITAKDVDPSAFNYKRIKCGLDIDVRISQADWIA